MDSPVFVIRGTGTKIDGSLVTASPVYEAEGGWYHTVRPVGHIVDTKYPVLIHEKHLQRVEDRLSRFTYKITVSKHSGDALVDPIEQDSIAITNALRNMSIKTILNRLESELGPILRLE